MTNSEYVGYLEKFMLQLSQQEYYDAHESLEAIWFPKRFEDDDEIRLIKGFINASVSFELIKKGRLDASDKVWKNYLKYKDLINKIDSIYTSYYKTIIIQIESIKASYL